MKELNIDESTRVVTNQDSEKLSDIRFKRSALKRIKALEDQVAELTALIKNRNS